MVGSVRECVKVCGIVRKCAEVVGSVRYVDSM